MSIFGNRRTNYRASQSGVIPKVKAESVPTALTDGQVAGSSGIAAGNLAGASPKSDGGGSYRGGEPMIDKTVHLTDEQRVANELAAKGDRQQGVSDTNPLLSSLEEQKAQKAKTFVNDGTGRAVNSWLGANVGTKPFKPETKERSRQQVRYITALGDVMRGINDMYFGARGASITPQTNQTAVMDAQWKQSDAEEATKAKLAAEQARADQKLQNDYYFKMLGAQNNADRLAETKRNNAFNQNLAAQNYGLKAEEQGWKREDRPNEQAMKAAGLKAKEAQAKKAESDAEWAGKINAAKLSQIRQATATSAAQMRHANASTAKINIEKNQLINGGGNFQLSGNQGTFSRKSAASPAEKANIIYRAHKAGLIDDATYTAVHSKSSWTSDVEFQTKQDDVISQLLDYAGDEEIVRDIFTSNGFHYQPYKAETKTYKPQK